MPTNTSVSLALASFARRIMRLIRRLAARMSNLLKRAPHEEPKETSAEPAPPTETTALCSSSPSPQTSFHITPRSIYTAVVIPDMFQSFVSHSPAINGHYEVVKADSEDWIGRTCSFSPKMQAKINKCDFSFFCAVAAPLAPRARFRTLCDWGNWVFPYDDMFDSGRLKDAPQASKAMMHDLMAPMLGHGFDEKTRLPILKVHDTVVERLSKKTRPAVQKRFAAAMAKYCHGALIQVEDQVAGRTPTLEEMVLIRRESAGVQPLYHLVEYAHDLQVPDEAFNDPLIQELEILGSDLVSISNDILSYRKEEREGVMHNMVAICRLSGMSAQCAFDEVSRLLNSRYERWDAVEAMLAKSKFAGNEAVASYVYAIKCVVQANISWSFRSERYLGRQANQVRCSRKMEVLTDPPYLTANTRG